MRNSITFRPKGKSAREPVRLPVFIWSAFLSCRAKGRLIVPLLLGVGIVLNWQIVGLATPNSLVANVRVRSTPVGISTRYIGACEGNVNFDLADMTDLSINTYRIYGGMSRWETDESASRFCIEY